MDKMVTNVSEPFCFGDDSHQHDARHSHHCEDRRDAETAHLVCTVLSYLSFQPENQTTSPTVGNKTVKCSMPFLRASRSAIIAEAFFSTQPP